MEQIEIEEHADPLAPCECGGCEWEGPVSALAEPAGAVLTPGDPVPAGRCPECEALAYLAAPNHKLMLATIHAMLDGAEWDSETMSAVAGVLTDNGYKIRGPDENPEGNA